MPDEISAGKARDMKAHEPEVREDARGDRDLSPGRGTSRAYPVGDPYRVTSLQRRIEDVTVHYERRLKSPSARFEHRETAEPVARARSNASGPRDIARER